MKRLTTSFFLIVFLFGNDYLFAQTPSIKPVKKEFFFYDTVSIVFNGVLRNDGGYEWNPLWGALKRSANGWDTLIDVRRLVTMKETIPYTTFNNYKRNFIVIDTLPILWTDDKLYPNEYLLLRDGEYILTALSKDGKIIFSEPFFIRTYLEPVVIIAPWSEPPIPPPTPDFHKEYNEIQTFVDIEVEFPGGHKALMSYLSNNLVIPLFVLENELQGRVVVRFVIEKDGSVSNVSVMRGIPKCPECDKEAIQLMKNMPKWKPALSTTEHISEENVRHYREPKPVRCYYNLPITFKSSNYPILPQGYETLKNYLTSNLIYPKRVLKEKIEGKVSVKLLFSETGEMKDVVLLKGMENCPECDKEAIRLMKSVPKEIMKANNEYNSSKPFFFNTYLEFKAE